MRQLIRHDEVGRVRLSEIAKWFVLIALLILSCPQTGLTHQILEPESSLSELPMLGKVIPSLPITDARSRAVLNLQTRRREIVSHTVCPNDQISAANIRHAQTFFGDKADRGECVVNRHLSRIGELRTTREDIVDLADAQFLSVGITESESSPFSKSKFIVRASAPPDETKVCITAHNAPPMSAYSWAPDTQVKVYFTRGMFTAKERKALIAALKIWSEPSIRTHTGVSFLYAGESEDLVTCQGCLNVTRQDVFESDHKHYAWFRPQAVDSEFLLVSASIQLDFATTKTQALQSMMLHELGHSMGLRDCESCQRKKTIMGSFPGINKGNDLVAPSACDLEVVRRIYLHRRRAEKDKAQERDQ